MNTLLQINVEVNFGSTGRIAEDIGQLAIHDGWTSYIAYGRKKRNSASRLIPIGNRWNHFIHLLQTRFLDQHGLASKRATRAFISRIKDIQPSIIHLHNIHGYYINYELLFEYLSTSNIPIVWTLHDCWAITGHCTHFTEVGCTKWQTSCHQCPQLDVYPSSLGRDRSKKNQFQKKAAFNRLKNLMLVPVSEWLSGIYKKSFLSHHNCRTIPNGVDTTVFQPTSYTNLLEKYQLKGTFIILGVASVWSEKKGLQDFISLSKLLQSDEIVVLIGLTKKQLGQLPHNIIGIERTENIKELAQWYSLADVYVNTSLEESFGLTNAEALACGTPIIVYDATASPEMVVPEVGFINEKKNIELLYRNIDQIKQDGKQYYSNACRNRALDRYDKNKIYAEYLELYSELLV